MEEDRIVAVAEAATADAVIASPPPKMSSVATAIPVCVLIERDLPGLVLSPPGRMAGMQLEFGVRWKERRRQKTELDLLAFEVIQTARHNSSFWSADWRTNLKHCVSTGVATAHWPLPCCATSTPQSLSHLRFVEKFTVHRRDFR